MPTCKGKAWSVFPTQQRDGTRAVTQVIVRPTDPHTVRVAKDLVARSEAVILTFAPDPEIAFYVSIDGPQPLPGDDLEWDTHQVAWRRADGSAYRTRKLGYDFDPNVPLH